MEYEFVRYEDMTGGRKAYEALFEECANNLQGFYGRWYYDYYLLLSDEEKDNICDTLKENHVETMMDFIIFMEE